MGDDQRPAARSNRTPFGAGANLQRHDVRQSYCRSSEAGARGDGPHAGSRASIHFSHNCSASHQTEGELGYETSEEDAKKPFVEVSGRKGLGVKADDLIDRLERTAAEEVAKRNDDLPAEEVARIGRQIAVAAVRYFMVKYSRGKVIAFDIAEALSFEGESGPYLQYAVVRANNIFSKLAERLSLSEDDVRAQVESLSPEALTSAEGAEAWGLILEAARLDEIVEQVVRTLEFSVLAKHAFSLAQAFNAFYHRAPILNEERADVLFGAPQPWLTPAAAHARST